MKKLIIIIALTIILKRFDFAPTIFYSAVPILLTCFLIKTMVKGATGKTKHGKTGTIYDDYL